MDAYVQFIRNALCCIKDLNLFPNSMIHDNTYTKFIFESDYTSKVFPTEPMNKTTPLELFISITQLYACLSLMYSGYTLVNISLGKLQRIYRLVQQRANDKKEEKSSSQQQQVDVLANYLINQSLLKESNFAIRSIFIGCMVFPIGVGFFWLFMNSLHISETNWFGGVAAVIHSLEVMEICLIPLLYYMIIDGYERFTVAKRMKQILAKLQYVLEDNDKDELLVSDITLPYYEAMTGWVPFWDSGVTIFTIFGVSSSDTKDPNTPEKEEQLVNEEFNTIKKKLLSIMIFDDDDDDDSKKKKDGDDDDSKEKEAKIRKEHIQEIVDKLIGDIPVQTMEGYREFVYFVCNFVAFYGYLMAPLCFYYADDDDDDDGMDKSGGGNGTGGYKQPYYIKVLKLFSKNQDADWYGNFFGDVMWTIEPLIILTSPLLAVYLRNQAKKKQAVAVAGAKNKVGGGSGGDKKKED